MTRQKHILIIGSQHGDERLGPHLFSYLKKHHPELLLNIDYICGNPKAYRTNVRYIESDLNRSYIPANDDSPTYEERRAKKILKYISSRNYDFVLDIHTSTADVDRFFLTVSLNKTVRYIISKSQITRVAIMPDHIANCSLIGQIAHAVSIEYNHELVRNQRTLLELTEMLQNLITGTASHKQSREIYYIQDPILPETDIGTNVRNFEKVKNGTYPILYGEKSYKKYKGFAATHRKVVIL